SAHICFAPPAKGGGRPRSGPLVPILPPPIAPRTLAQSRWRYVSKTLQQPLASAGRERTRVQLCGRLSVELDGAEIVAALRGRQVRPLLAYLVINRDRRVGRDELIGAVWPETA